MRIVNPDPDILFESVSDPNFAESHIICVSRQRNNPWDSNNVNLNRNQPDTDLSWLRDPAGTIDQRVNCLGVCTGPLYGFTQVVYVTFPANCEDIPCTLRGLSPE